MALFERKIGRRVAGIAVAAALLVLGLAAPAFAAAPTDITFLPTTGAAGTTVTITAVGGTFTTPITAVTFGGVAAFSFTSGTSTLSAIVPAGAPGGAGHKIAVTDSSPTTVTSTADFVVTALPAPTVSSISPTCGNVGSTVTINGTNLIGAKYGTGKVTFTLNKDAVTWSVVSPTQVTATVPSGATNGVIKVTTDAAAGGGGSANSPTFYVSATCPTITSFLPTSGGAGTSVVITGTNFTGATSVKFNGVAATTFTVNSATQITATVPTGATTGKITVQTPSGVATSTSDFTVVPTPTITSFTPTSGPVGTSVTITGTNLSGATSVKFNGTTATITSNTATQIVTTVPAGATTGKITVTTAGGTATSATKFTVTGLSHARSISLRLRDALVARGKVTVSDRFAACKDSVPVKVQRRVSGHWKTVKNTTTSSTGSYRVHLRNKHGRYRSLAPRVTTGTDTCRKAVSSTQTH